MIAKEDLLHAMLRECDICVHLAGKVPTDRMDFRFTPPQRSTLELLRYLSFAPLALARAVVDGSWDAFKAAEEESKSLMPEDFAAAMQRQKAALSDLFARVTDADLDRDFQEWSWSEPMKVGPSLLAQPYAALVAYRMQLFLQAKAAGNAALDSADCRHGVDAPTPTT